MTTQEASVKEAVALYVAGAASLDDLAARLPDGWELDEADDAALTDLVLRVMGLVAEVQAGDMSEPQARYELRPDAAWLTTSDVTADALTVDLGWSVTTAARFAGVGTELPAEFV